MLNKLQQKVTKLQASLDSQAHLQSDLEAEVTEKNKEIDARGKTEQRKHLKLTFLISPINLKIKFVSKTNLSLLIFSSYPNGDQLVASRPYEIRVLKSVLRLLRLVNLELKFLFLPLLPLSLEEFRR